jgi:hypothetical protein
MQHAQRKDATDNMHNGQHCNGHLATRNGMQRTALQRTPAICNAKKHATCVADIRQQTALQDATESMQRTAVVPWYRACVRRAAARKGEGHFSAILNGCAAQCIGF